MKFVADLHIHSNCSDGELSVDEILTEGKRLGLKFIGIVDHDTLKQFDEVKKSPLSTELRKSGVRVWVATEFSAKIDGLKLHLLGYNFDPRNEKIEAVIRELQDLRKDQLKYHLITVRSKGLYISKEQEESLEKIENVGMPHIARCLMENGVEGSMSFIIENYIKTPKLFRADYLKVIDAVHSAGGIVVIAHPYQIATENNITEAEAAKVWEKLARQGVDGVECFYSKYDLNKIRPLIDFSKTHNLLITFGSDFHGAKTKPEIKIGDVIKDKQKI